MPKNRVICPPKITIFGGICPLLRGVPLMGGIYTEFPHRDGTPPYYTPSEAAGTVVHGVPSLVQPVRSAPGGSNLGGTPPFGGSGRGGAIYLRYIPFSHQLPGTPRRGREFRYYYVSF